MDNDTVPVTGVDELDAHLDDLIADPAMKPTVKLFDDVELQLNQANTPPLIPRLLPKITEILKQYQQDPAVLCSLAVKLLGPVSFTQVLSMASEEALIQALRSPAPSANLLAMAILEKAARSPADAAILAMMNNLISAFITTWLSAPQVEVGERGTKILGDLLDTDCDAPPLSAGVQSSTTLNGMEIAVRNKPPGQGLMWRRIFHDRDIYGLVLSLGSRGPHQSAEGGLSEQQLTLAQGRLLRLTPRLAALNLAAISHTDFPDLNERYVSAVAGDQGLLHFVALHMVDKEDLLMHLNLIDFFEEFVSLQRITPYSTFKMDTLRKLMKDALKGDDRLRSAMVDLPNRTVPEEAEELRKFVREILQL
ncbi:hypothetical protein PG993_003701 [Apiospora rasikravindrae]|uniref:DNA mismatch repair protein HSM3 N-terminal domain-containing protein n=1 Tax=Apiospora rasikravindrae TaxID=990691 RepID=A0ABR1U095_9PEZI